MAAPITTALDAMGGDNGAETAVPGAEIALRRQPDLRFMLFGDESVLTPMLERYPLLKAAAVVEHCDVAIRMDDKPSQALRHGRYRSSMWRAIDAVKTGKADYAVSAGNTGALMAMAKFCLQTAGAVDRPAIAGLWPNPEGESVVLDLGATIGANAQALFDFAFMGAAMARALTGKPRPRVGLLNIGVEEVKGLEEIRDAGQMLRDADVANFEYVGFVEGNDIGKGSVDVVVTEGFAGNIALKTAEGTARQIAGYLRDAMRQTLRARLGYLLARNAFARLRTKIDPGRLNGGVFLGLNGIVIKSHGGADPEGFASAIEIGRTVARDGLVGKINRELSYHHSSTVSQIDNASVVKAGVV
jgi:glycerol-3-phosphate acyltransferase PlsX